MKNIIKANLSGKNILITGSAHGLGAFYAEVLAKNGAHVIVSGRENAKEQLELLVEKITIAGHKATKCIIDLTDFANFDRIIGNINAQLGNIDVLINNAAISIDRSLFEITEKDWDIHMNTNLKGLFFLSQAVAKQMVNNLNGGKIIKVAAINGEKVRKNCIAFGTSKAGVIHLTKSMAYELADYNIKVNGISLGLIESSDTVREFLKANLKASEYINQIPVKRVGQLEDLAGPILLLASDASNYMHGSIIHVDGGFASGAFMHIDVKA